MITAGYGSNRYLMPCSDQTKYNWSDNSHYFALLAICSCLAVCQRSASSVTWSGVKNWRAASKRYLSSASPCSSTFSLRVSILSSHSGLPIYVPLFCPFTPDLSPPLHHVGQRSERNNTSF